MKWPLGIFSWFGYELPIGERVRLIRQAGFEATGVWWGPENYDYSRGQHHAIPEMIRDAGLGVDNVHVSYRQANELLSADEGVRRAAVDEHLRWLDDCARHEIPTMVMHAARGPEKGRPGTEGLESVQEYAAKNEGR